MNRTSIAVGGAIAIALTLATCGAPSGRPVAVDSAGVDSLNARLVETYRLRDPAMYASLFTDSAVFEWPAFNTVRGRSALDAMVRGHWPSLNDMTLELDVAARRYAPDHVTELGAFRQSWRDAKGVRMTEFGRYVSVLARGDSGWLIDRFFGFADSTRPGAPR